MERVILPLAMVAAAVGWSAWSRAVEEEAAAFRHQMRVGAEDPSPAGLLEHNGYYYQSNEFALAGMEPLIGPGAERAPRVGANADDPVVAIADFSHRLAERGIELWVVPVPARSWVNARQIRDSPWWMPTGAYGEPFSDFVDTLQRDNVIAFDMLPQLQRGAVWDPERWVRVSDAHWTNEAVVSVAETLASDLRRKPWLDDVAPIDTTYAWRTIERRANIGAFASVRTGEKERFRVRTVQRVVADEAVRLEEHVRESPIVVLGDSHVHWYGGAEADIGRQLAMELGIEVDTLTVTGGGATRAREELVRRDWIEPGYLDHKKVVIWIWWAVSIRNSEWRIVRLDPLPPTRLSGEGGELQVSSDHPLIRNGVGQVSMNDRWRLPDDLADNTGRGAIWLRKPDGTLTFSGTPKTLVFTTEVKGDRPQRVRLALDGKRLTQVRLPKQSSLRFRVLLPDLEPGLHTLTVNNTPFQSMRVGFRDMIATDTARLYADGFDRIPAGSTGITFPRRQYGTGAMVGAREVSLPLAFTGEPTVLRLRMQPFGPRPMKVDVRLGEHVVATGVTFPPGRWTEVALPLTGYHTDLGTTLRLSSPGRRAQMLIDLVEVDGLSRPGAAPTR